MLRGRAGVRLPHRSGVTLAIPAGEERVRVLLGVVLGPAVALLQLAQEAVLVAADLLPVVAGQVAEVGAGLAADLLPFALDDIPVGHAVFSLFDRNGLA